MIATSAATCTTNSAPGAGEPPPPNRIAAIKREPAISTRMLGGACPVRIQRHSFVAGIALIEAMQPRRPVKAGATRRHRKIGRASWRERVGQYGLIPVVAVS